MQKYLLVDDCNGGLDILDQVFASSLEGAKVCFIAKGWGEGEVMSEEDLKNECDLNALESQSPE